MSRPKESGNSILKSLILLIALLVNTALGVRLFYGEQSLFSYSDLSSQQAELKVDLAKIDDINRSLSREIRLLQSDVKYVEKMIRLRLNFVQDNEILYLFADETAGASK